MKRLNTLWFVWILFVSVYGQVIQVVDSTSNDPLTEAWIYNVNQAKAVITDENGEAEFVGLNLLDTLFVRKLGYKPHLIVIKKMPVEKYRVFMVPISNTLGEVTISSYVSQNVRYNSLQIESLSISEIEASGSLNLSDAIAKLPGITQLSTGPGITKPVINGLYGNRILVLFSGLRFDNQQWQDEHGLGLSTVGISKVEVLKGPLSILYGTEALGGMINILEEKPPLKGTSQTSFNTRVNSNTGGLALNLGYKANLGKYWYRFRLGAVNHADYTDGNKVQVANSRFNGYIGKASFGYHGKRWNSINHFTSSYNKFGFVFSDITGTVKEDQRWQRAMTGPHHLVLLNVFSSINTIKLPKARLEINAGIQSNNRSEDEGGGYLSLQMHLLTGQYAAKFRKPLKKDVLWVVANNGIFESNQNYGRRKIVPDALMIESNISTYIQKQSKSTVYECGVGAGLKQINTQLTPTVNSVEKDIAPFTQLRTFVNAMLGLSHSVNKQFSLKLNVSTGVRAPNLAELSSNGLHEGIYIYEIGNPHLNNEQNVNMDGGLNVDLKQWEFSSSLFFNQFFNYIYLQPSTDEWFGFPIYRFVQDKAQIYGGEIRSKYLFKRLNGLEASLTYSGLQGQLVTHNYLPYMPAQVIQPEIRYESKNLNKPNWHFFVNDKLVQNKLYVNSEEMKTPGYSLLNVGLGIKVKKKNSTIHANLVGNNLLNEAYFDHLSRYKNFGLLNMGRNITLNVKLIFNNNLKTKQ